MFAVAGGKAVAQEEHVELRALGGGGDVLHQAEVRPACRLGIRMPPAGDVMAGRLHEDAEPHLFVVHCSQSASLMREECISQGSPSATNFPLSTRAITRTSNMMSPTW